jgi:hypothetical protein
MRVSGLTSLTFCILAGKSEFDIFDSFLVSTGSSLVVVANSGVGAGIGATTPKSHREKVNKNIKELHKERLTFSGQWR